VVVETLSLLCATLGEGVLPLSCDVVAVGCCFLVPSRGTAAARVYLLVLVWISRIILSSKGQSSQGWLHAYGWVTIL
jgi:hypothetical protein